MASPNYQMGLAGLAGKSPMEGLNTARMYQLRNEYKQYNQPDTLSAMQQLQEEIDRQKMIETLEQQNQTLQNISNQLQFQNSHYKNY